MHKNPKIRLLSLLGLGLAGGAGGCIAASESHETEQTKAPSAALSTEGASMFVPLSAVRRDFFMRQRLVGEFDGHKIRLDAVIQKQGASLSVVGLTPFGTKAFVLKQEGNSIFFESFMASEMPFPARYILEDIHRSFLWDVLLPWGQHGENGAQTFRGEGTVVIERWEDDKLLSRTFESPDRASRISIDYGTGMHEGHPPRTLKLVNDRQGYILSIETAQFQILNPN